MPNELNVLNNTETPPIETPKEQERISVSNIPPKSIGERELQENLISDIVTSALEVFYPVGSIYISTVSTNPATLFGFGTWTAFGAGKTLVGLNSGDTDFDTAEETGGAKTHTLTSAEMPSHTHTQNAHTHDSLLNNAGSGGTLYPVIANAVDTTNLSIAHLSSVAATNQNTGGGGAHNNLQPYIVTYMFKRTA